MYDWQELTSEREKMQISEVISNNGISFEGNTFRIKYFLFFSSYFIHNNSVYIRNYTLGKFSFRI